MQRRAFLKTSLSSLGVGLVVTQLPGTAWAGRELTNNLGQYDGAWNAKVKVQEEGKEDVTFPKLKVELQERFIRIYFDTETVACRHDQIYTTGYKTEITARHSAKPITYFITINASISRD